MYARKHCKVKIQKIRQNIFNMQNKALTALTNKESHRRVRSEHLYKKKKVDQKQEWATYKGRNTND